MNTGKRLILLAISMVFFMTGCEYGDIAELAAKKLNPPLFIAVGDSCTILYSEDGITWTDTFSDGDTLKGITSGGGKCIAVGSTGNIMLSVDGKTWNNVLTTGIGLNAVAYGNGRFVAVGVFQSMLCQMRYSLDGITWYDKSANYTYPYLDIVFGDGQFYAFGQTIGYATPDGETWTNYPTPSYTFQDGVYVNGTYTIVGDGPTIRFSTDDLATWDDGASGGGLPSTLTGIAYGNGRYVVVGSAGSASWSVDGMNWNLESMTSSSQLNDITFGGGKFVAVGMNGEIWYSSDGISWSQASSPNANTLNAVTYKP